jgi:hypothetical protein
MNSPLTNLQKEAFKVSLSQDEKRIMHARIMERVRAKASEDASAPRSRAGLYYFFAPQFSMALAAVMVVIVGGGTAYAAQGALPGEPLYVVKTKVTEPLRGAIAFSTEDKIRYHSRMTQARLEEAEILASQNRLDALAKVELESSIEAHISKRLELASRLDEMKPGKGSKEIARYDTTITAHGDILAQLGEGSSSSTTRENSNLIASRVRSSNNSRFGYNAGNATPALSNTAASATEQAVEPMMATMSIVAEDSISTSGDIGVSLSLAPSSSGQENARATGSQEKVESKDANKKKKDDSRARAALAFGKKATSTLEELRAKIASMQDKVDGATRSRLNARFERIEERIALGEKALARHDYQEAEDYFEEALAREATLSVFIHASIKFNKGILGSLLDNDSRWGDN